MKKISLLLFLILLNANLFCDPIKLPKADAVLISEALKFQDKIGSKIWKEWSLSKLPIVYKVNRYDFYLNNPKKPLDSEIYFDEILDDSISVVHSADSNHYQAAFPLKDISISPNCFSKPI